MFKRLLKLNVVIAVLAVAAATLVGAQFVSANEVTNTANTLKVSPVRTDVEIMPGDTDTVKTTVSNLTDSAITVRPIANDFVSSDESGTPALILDADEYAPSHSLKRFMAPLPDVTIPAGEAKVIEVEISVPKDAKAGGYFGSIRFAPTSPDDGGQVNMSASVASLILLTVPGDFTERLNLTHFNVQQDGKSGTLFSTPSALRASFRFENAGDVQLGPTGKIFVKHGDEVIYEADFNNERPREVALPGGARRWDVPLQDIGTFGKYTVMATFSYGQKNQTIEVEESFWVIPTAIFIAAGLVLLLLIGLVIAVIIFTKRRKKRRIRRR